MELHFFVALPLSVKDFKPVTATYIISNYSTVRQNKTLQRRGYSMANTKVLENVNQIFKMDNETEVSIAEVADLYMVSEDNVQQTISDCLDEFLDDGYVGGKMKKRAVKRLGILLESEVAYKFQQTLLDRIFKG